MAITKEWECAAHGEFESADGACPYGCKGTARRVILTAPGFKSRRTSNADEVQKHIAHTMGVNNYSNRNGSVASSTRLRHLTPEQQKAKSELEGYERQYVAEKGGTGNWNGRMRFNNGEGVLAGKEVPAGPISIAMPNTGHDAQGRPTFNRAALPPAMAGTSGNNIGKLPSPRALTRTFNRPDDPMGHKE